MECMSFSYRYLKIERSILVWGYDIMNKSIQYLNVGQPLLWSGPLAGNTCAFSMVKVAISSVKGANV